MPSLLILLHCVVYIKHTDFAFVFLYLQLGWPVPRLGLEPDTSKNASQKLYRSRQLANSVGGGCSIGTIIFPSLTKIGQLFQKLLAGQ